MKIFLSWSGAGSRELAKFLRVWLRDVLQSVETYMSEEDIAKGSVWFTNIAEGVAGSAFCLVCLTRSNQGRPWVNFEAGAATDRLQKENVSAILIDLSETDVAGPLGQFQHVRPTREDVQLLIATLNRLTDAPLDDDRLKRTFDTYWPALEEALEEARRLSSEPGSEKPKSRSSEDLLDEVLTLSRSNSLALEELRKAMSAASAGPTDAQKIYRGLGQLLARGEVERIQRLEAVPEPILSGYTDRRGWPPTSTDPIAAAILAGVEAVRRVDAKQRQSDGDDEGESEDE